MPSSRTLLVVALLATHISATAIPPLNNLAVVEKADDLIFRQALGRCDPALLHAALHTLRASTHDDPSFATDQDAALALRASDPARAERLLSLARRQIDLNGTVAANPPVVVTTTDTVPPKSTPPPVVITTSTTIEPKPTTAPPAVASSGPLTTQVASTPAPAPATTPTPTPTPMPTPTSTSVPTSTNTPPSSTSTSETPVTPSSSTVFEVATIQPSVGPASLSTSYSVISVDGSPETTQQSTPASATGALQTPPSAAMGRAAVSWAAVAAAVLGTAALLV